MRTDSSAARITSAAAVEMVCEAAALGDDDGKADAAASSAGSGDEDAGGEKEATVGGNACTRAMRGRCPGSSRREPRAGTEAIIMV